MFLIKNCLFTKITAVILLIAKPKTLLHSLFATWFPASQMKNRNSFHVDIEKLPKKNSFGAKKFNRKIFTKLCEMLWKNILSFLFTEKMFKISKLYSGFSSSSFKQTFSQTNCLLICINSENFIGIKSYEYTNIK